MTGLILEGVLALALVMMAINLPCSIKNVKADPKNLRMLWQEEAG